MKKFLLSAFLLISIIAPVYADVVIDEKTYVVDTLIRKEIGPGVVYHRIRIPEYPLNINTLTVDLTNQYNRIETTVGNEVLGSTESLANAYVRQSVEGKQPLAAANANFWCTVEKPYSDYIKGTPFGGSLRNGKILTETNMHWDLWDGGAERTGIVSVDTNKKLWIESMSWRGYVKCAKWSEPRGIDQINKMYNVDELVMYNSYYGTKRAFNTGDGNTEVFFKLKEGEIWGTNKDIKAVVMEIKPNSGGNVLGDYDFCLSATGAHKLALEQLAIGDEVTLNYAWKSYATGDEPFIEQLVAGNAIVLKDGELTGRNYDEGYNSQVYSRTGYGMSKDGKTLHVIVIDKSNDPVYGNSVGCSTAVMSQIMQQSGCWNLCTMDAGGSAQMMVQGSVINKTTEGAPRAVANGWMLYSVAPRSSEIARIEFADYYLQSPVYASYEPVIYGYNQYGDLINEDVKDFTLSCDASIGTASGTVFNAGGTPGTGDLTATYNGVSVTKKLTILNAQMNLRVKPLLIDNIRKHTMEVVSEINGNVYKCDPSRLEWTIEDSSVASIDANGVLTGLKNGTTKISCSLADFSDETEVTVEIPESKELYQSFDGWTLKATGAKNLVLGGDGVLSMTYNGGRGANIKISKDIVFYSLPDKIILDFTSTIPFSYIQADYRKAGMTSANYVNYGKETGFEAGKRYQLELSISDLGDPADLILYPLSLHCFIFYPATGATTGENNITIHGLYAVYPQGGGSVEDLINDKSCDLKVYPNPVEDGFMMISSPDIQNARVTVINRAGSIVMETSADINNGSASINVSSLLPDLYFVKIESKEYTTVKKIIIR